MKAKKQPLEDYIVSTGVYSGLSINARIKAIKKIINNTHPKESLMSNDVIYPRGIDFFQEVILKSFNAYEVLSLVSLKEKQKLFKTNNYEWTRSWVEKICIWNNLNFNFDYKEDISISEFSIIYSKNKKSISQFFNRHTDLKKYLYADNNVKYILAEGINYILLNHYIDDEIKRMSKFISDNLNHLKSEYDFIQLKKFKKFTRIRTIKNSSIKTYDAKMIIKESLGNTYYDVVDKLKKMHPHEDLIISLKESSKKYEQGIKKLTPRGMDWYQNIYLKFRSDQQLLIHEDIINSLNYLKSNNIGDYDYSDISLKELSSINCIDISELENILFPFYKKYIYKTNILNVSFISKKGLKELEEDYPIFRIRHLSFYIAKNIPNGLEIKDIEMKADDKSMFEVNDLESNTTYKGTISRNFSTVGIDSLTKIITFDVGLENEDIREVKVRIPYSLLQEKKIYNMLLAFTPITFEIEESKNNKKRIKWFRLYSKIIYELNWDNCLFEYVAVKKRCRKKEGGKT